MRPPQNIPIEILRTAVAIADGGTFSGAAKRLGISQPAVSAQIKRLQHIVGGDVFQKSVGGSVPTALGQAVLLLARKTLETHDQILRLTASGIGPKRVRIGFSSLLVGQFMAAQTAASNLANVFIQSDNSDVLERALLQEHLDIACCFAVNEIGAELRPFVVAESEDHLVWVRSKNFVLSPGRPIPIVTWRGDDWITSALVQHGLAYQIVFDGQDFEAKRFAVEAAQGITALPSRLVPSSLIRAREYYLPPLPTIRTVLYAKPTVETETGRVLRDRIQSLFFKNPDAEFRPAV